jgi:hypothetical protein
MDSPKLLCLAAAFVASVAVVGSQSAKAAPAHEHFGSCGEYRYWHAGHCVDARDRQGNGWSDSMATKKALW